MRDLCPSLIEPEIPPARGGQASRCVPPLAEGSLGDNGIKICYTISMAEPVVPKIEPTIKVDPEINFFGMTNYRNQNRKFGIKLDDRRRHMYVVGKTGMGKTTILENMVLNDIYSGHGVGVVDPHGDFAEKIINYVPPNRINDIVYFNPADLDYPIGFNILETIRPDQKHLIASGLMGVFKKIWPDVWSARMEYILNNTILALLDFPGTTLLGINRMLADEEYRKRVVNNTKDPVVKAYWQTEFANYSDKFRSEAVSPIQNKIGQFLSASVIRNIVAQVKSRINIREIMDEQKIFIMNLSKGRIGEDNSRLLGGMLITKIQLSAMERVDIPEPTRKDFFLYVDEFQNFATESFANILSEARKYRLDLIMAHQYMEQLDETVLASVIGNVGTMVTFRVGSTDAEILAKEFAPTFIEEDLVNLPKFHTYLKLMIDGVASRPFSALTLPPIGSPTNSTEKVVRVSRERYAVPREKIEDKIARWSGMVVMTDEEAAALEMDEDEAAFKNPMPTPVASALRKPDPISSQPAVHRPDASISMAAPKISTPREPPRQGPPQNSIPSLVPRPMTPPALVSLRPQSAPASRPLQPVGAQSSSGQAQDGQRKRKRKRKKSSSGGGPSGGETVLLVDPNQRGISLNQMLGGNSNRDRQPSSQRNGGQEQSSRRSSQSPASTSPPPADDSPAPLDIGLSISSAPTPTPKTVLGFLDHNTPAIPQSQSFQHSRLLEQPQPVEPPRPPAPSPQAPQPTQPIHSSPKTIQPGRVVKIED